MKRIFMSLVILTLLATPAHARKLKDLNSDDLAKPASETVYNLVKLPFKILALPFYWLEKVKK